VRARCEAIAVMKRFIYREEADGGKTKINARRDPRQKVLSRFPNPETTRFEFEWMMGLQDHFYGNSFAYLEFDEKFKCNAMWALKSRNMEIARDPNTRRLIYRYAMPDGTKEVFPDWRIHHRKGPSLDGMVGLSVFELAMNSVALGLALEEYSARIFANDATPRGILTTKNKLSPAAKEQIREEMHKNHKGLKNAGKLGILDGELEFKAVGLDNNVMQFVETYENQRERIAAWFRVPQHLAGILSESTNNNIEQQHEEFVEYTVVPDLERIELSYERDILSEDEKNNGYMIRHTIEDMERGDFEGNNTRYIQELMNGVLSRNEYRAIKNRNPVEHGDEFWQPTNLIVIGEDPQPAPTDQPKTVQNNVPGVDNEDTNPGNTPKRPKKGNKRAEYGAFRPVIEDACRRIAGRELVAIEREIKRAKTAKEVFDFCEGFFPEQREFGEKALQPVLRTIGDATGELLISDQNRIINGCLLNFKQMAQTDLLKAPELGLPAMQKVCEEWSTTRANYMTEKVLSWLEEVRYESEL